MPRLGKRQRHEKLLNELQINPFQTDEELAKSLGVSIQTIRLDRMELDIAELRERMKTMATNTLQNEQFIQGYRLLGEFFGGETGKQAYSLLTINSDMVVPSTGITRPYFLVAQAHSAALHIFDQPDLVFTSAANVKYLRPTKVGEKLLASAILSDTQKNRHRIKVVTQVGQTKVFRATFHIYADFNQFADGEKT